MYKVITEVNTRTVIVTLITYIYNYIINNKIYKLHDRYIVLKYE